MHDATAPLSSDVAATAAPTAALADQHAPDGHRGGFSGFMKELQRRRVFRVASAYALVGWLVIQVADVPSGLQLNNIL